MEEEQKRTRSELKLRLSKITQQNVNPEAKAKPGPELLCGCHCQPLKRFARQDPAPFCLYSDMAEHTRLGSAPRLPSRRAARLR